MLYSTEQTASIHQEDLAFIKVKEDGHVLTITLNRPGKKNALHPVMVNELAYAVHYAQHHDHIWVVVLDAVGDVFCAGADLKAFSGQAEEVSSSIPKPAGDVLLGEIFNKLHKPSIAKVEGNVYAGGFLLLAGCTYVLANNDVKLGLPETRRGLFPFQVMASLMAVMPERKVLDWCIRGYNLEVEQAHEWGLVTHVTIEENIESDLQQLLNQILANSPTAIRMGMEAYDHIRQRSTHQEHEYLLSMLMKTIQTKDAREGMAAFREKRAPEWTNQ